MITRLVLSGVILLCTVSEAFAEVPIYNNGAPALSLGPIFSWIRLSSTGEVIPDLMTADDFRLSSDSILTSVQFWTLTPFDGGNSGTLASVRYSIFPDDSGAPGSIPLAAGIGLITRDVVTGRVTGGGDRHFEREIAFDLSAPVQLRGEQTYWLGLAVVGTAVFFERPTRWELTDGPGNLMVTDLRAEPLEWIADSGNVAFVLYGSVGVPCDAPWKNHGEYVSTVSKMANQLLADGVITEEQKDSMVEAAAQSNCGKKH